MAVIDGKERQVIEQGQKEYNAIVAAREPVTAMLDALASTFRGDEGA